MAQLFSHSKKRNVQGLLRTGPCPQCWAPGTYYAPEVRLAILCVWHDDDIDDILFRCRSYDYRFCNLFPSCIRTARPGISGRLVFRIRRVGPFSACAPAFFQNHRSQLACSLRYVLLKECDLDSDPHVTNVWNLLWSGRAWYLGWGIRKPRDVYLRILGKWCPCSRFSYVETHDKRQENSSKPSCPPMSFLSRLSFQVPSVPSVLCCASSAVWQMDPVCCFESSTLFLRWGSPPFPFVVTRT